MQSNHLFKKILFPIDFSKSSIETLAYVVKLSKIFKAELFLLHTFRLLDPPVGNEEIGAKKRKLETNALNEFFGIEEKLLKYGDIRYMFQSEVGFISDRITSSIQEHKIDLVILSFNAQEKIQEREEKDCTSIIGEMQCTIMLMPETTNK